MPISHKFSINLFREVPIYFIILPFYTTNNWRKGS